MPASSESDEDAIAAGLEMEALLSIYGQELRELAPGEFEIDIPISLDGLLVECEGKSATVRHLLLTLQVRKPPGYPSRAAPEFALVSSWLDQQSGAHLLPELIAQWNAMREPILVSWVEHLRAEAAAGLMNHLHIADCTSPAPRAAVVGGDVVREPADARGAMVAILAEDARRVEAEDGARVLRCGICFDQKVLGSCTTFAGCVHTFCNGCLKIELEGRIRDGDASTLACPQCRAPLLPTEVRKIVAGPLFDLFEARSLQSSLAGMDDVIWCPLSHCQAPVLLDRAESGQLEQLGHCAQCSFAFCILCKRSWHGHGPCSDFKARWDRADADERARLEATFGTAMIEEVQSRAYISETTQKCPACRSAIEKNGGCNHITCAKCKYEWCWLCKGKYTPFHFQQTGCRQFSNDFFAEVALALANEERGS
jgi:E3 ubiquitin-protein ligase RNF14